MSAAPDFEALDQDGNPLRLSDFRGRGIFAMRLSIPSKASLLR